MKHTLVNYSLLHKGILIIIYTDFYIFYDFPVTVVIKVILLISQIVVLFWILEKLTNVKTNIKEDRFSFTWYILYKIITAYILVYFLVQKHRPEKIIITDKLTNLINGLRTMQKHIIIQPGMIHEGKLLSDAIQQLNKYKLLKEITLNKSRSQDLDIFIIY